MSTDWKETGIDLGVGAVAGVADQVVQNWDDKREANAHAKLPFFKQAGSYVNFLLPVVNLGLVAAGMVKGQVGSANHGSQCSARRPESDLGYHQTEPCYHLYRLDQRQCPEESSRAKNTTCSSWVYPGILTS